MRMLRSVVAVTLAAAPAVVAQTAEPPRGFTSVEIVGWDFSGLDGKIRAAVTKANAPGAGEAARRAAADALAARAAFLYEAGNPFFYKHALGDYRHVLRLRPDDAEARERADTIVSIYESMKRPVPTNGESKSGGTFLVELFRTTPKRVDFEPGKAYTEGGDVSELVAFVYEFEARAGQTLSVSVGSKDKGAAVFDLLLLDSSGARALVEGAGSKHQRLPSKGKYLIRVYSKGGAAVYGLKAELK
ncbi:MAG: PPC domain-containing protein [Pyrinomonadaceae bacterium]